MILNDTYEWVIVNEEYDIYHARFKIKQISKKLGFNSYEKAVMETCVSELAWNLVIHALGGKIGFMEFEASYKVKNIKKRDFIKALKRKNQSLIWTDENVIFIKGLEIISEDAGPGIGDIDHCLSEEYVSKKGLGRGLKSVRGMMDEFQIKSRPGEGTRIIVRKWLRVFQGVV